MFCSLTACICTSNVQSDHYNKKQGWCHCNCSTHMHFYFTLTHVRFCNGLMFLVTISLLYCLLPWWWNKLEKANQALLYRSGKQQLCIVITHHQNAGQYCNIHNNMSLKNMAWLTYFAIMVKILHSWRYYEQIIFRQWLLPFNSESVVYPSAI